MDSYLSSPDPLNDSPTYHSPIKARRNSKARYSLPVEGSSPTKQTFELDVGHAISRQKIRVTVEAGNSDLENEYEDSRCASRSPLRRPANKPLSRRRVQTMTTIVPLKGLSDSEKEAATTPKRSRGRPRKSGTPIPGNKRGRAGTPTQKKRRSVGTLVDGDDSEDFDFNLGQGVAIGQRKGRSRSKSATAAARKPTPSSEGVESLLDRLPSTTGKKGRGRRKSLLPEDIVVHEDEIREGDVGEGNVDEGENQPADITAALYQDDDNFSVPPQFSPQPESPNLIPRHESPNQASHSPQRGWDEDFGPNSVPASPEYQTEYEEEQEDDDDAGNECREFDTIMESEGFSMISVDSVPSFREHISSPAVIEEPKVPLEQARSKAILAVQAGEAGGREDSFSSIPEDLLETLTPAPKLQDPKLLVVQGICPDDSFSSIPSRLLEAVTPGSKGQVTPTPAVKGKGPLELQQREQSIRGTYDDSFSAIPADILESVTPAPVQYVETISKSGEHRKTSPASVAGPNNDSKLGNQSHLESSAQRLLTPDDTPSPEPEVCNEQDQPQNLLSQEITSVTEASKQNSASDSSVISYMKSSPPVLAPRRYTYSAHLRQQRELYPDNTETPSIVFSSPKLPPPIQFGNGHLLLNKRLEQDQQPKLSPTVRAGRVLQGIIVPTISPRGRAHSLGSPFKSPIADRKSSSSAALDINSSPGQEKAWKPLPRLDIAENIALENLPHSYSSQTLQQDDPFSNNAPYQQRSASPKNKQVYTLGLPGKRPLSDPRLSQIVSEDIHGRSDDAMSWQAEDEVQLYDSRTSLTNNVTSTNSRNSSTGARVSSSDAQGATELLESRWAAERAAVSQQVRSANANDVIVIHSDDEERDPESNDEDDLLLETINSSSPAAQDQRARKDTPEKLRRSKIPSPWRTSSRRLVYNDEASQLNPSLTAKTKSSGSETVWQIADETINAELSELPIPQKANFKPVMRNRGTRNISMLLASSPNRGPLPVLPKDSYKDNSLPSAVLSSYNTATVRRMEEPLAPIPQKMEFNPRIQLRGSKNTEASSPSTLPVKSNTIMKGILGVGSSARKPLEPPTPESKSSVGNVQALGESSPSRNNLPQPVQKHEEKPLSTPVSTDFYDSTNLSERNDVVESRTLQWTENVRLTSLQTPNDISPTRSCLRSPLKTPSASSGNSLSPSKNVAFVSSSPVPSSPINAPLSSTTWSRNHWQLLQSILQTWKPENQVGEERRRRNSTRVISKLLGKSISNGGQKLRLEQWHLEVVDEFRGEVPGWEELVIAKRVFALVCGEKLRAQGITKWEN